ncbi:Uma2 family endonuclease [Synechocystis sp. PCC 7509]|uniref:Uma2 family endonuclease n=1 Tax=Synechocystis sp. PCC 7509 TaxID=927677 RepID=UPI0002ABD642|nr:Uma2 family endonuclease [Synechocystis sp. PCC 7509]
MSVALTQKIPLDEFLRLPYLDDSPAWEYANGVAIQKPMPKLRHSILQKRLLIALDNSSDNYTALPELRCTFAGRSIVPDISVIAWNRIQVNDTGEPEDNFVEAPDWTIEILSPDQKVTRVIDNILHCLHHGCCLGWLVDPHDYSILTFAPQQEPNIYRGEVQVLILPEINLQITAAQIFNWLKLNQS